MWTVWERDGSVDMVRCLCELQVRIGAKIYGEREAKREGRRERRSKCGRGEKGRHEEKGDAGKGKGFE